MNTIIEVDFEGTELKVIEKAENLFDLYVGEEIRHPNKDAKIYHKSIRSLHP
jgi:hypothetical protein